MELFDSNPANITETTDQPEFFSNWNVQFDGHRANASGAANVSEEETTDDDFYRHSSIVTTVYCLAYSFVFLLGLVGNCLVVAVVFRAPRMRTVTNYFIVNLAIADILVVLFCLPATLLSNIFVRKYSFFLSGFWACFQDLIIDYCCLICIIFEKTKEIFLIKGLC